MPVIIGQNSNDEISFYFMDPNTFAKSLTGKPKLKYDLYILNIRICDLHFMCHSYNTFESLSTKVYL